MIRPFFTFGECLRRTAPSAQRRPTSNRRAAGTVFPFTLGTVQRCAAGGRGAGGRGGGGGGGAGGASQGGVASVVAFQLTGPAVHPWLETVIVPYAPRSAKNDPMSVPTSAKARLRIGSGVGYRRCAQMKVQLFPGMFVIRKLITPVHPGVTAMQTEPPPACVPR